MWFLDVREYWVDGIFLSTQLLDFEFPQMSDTDGEFNFRAKKRSQLCEHVRVGFRQTEIAVRGRQERRSSPGKTVERGK